MEYMTFTGKTISDALTQASVKLGVTSNQIDYEVIEKGSAGIFGLGSRDAVIRAKIHNPADDEPEAAEAEESSKEETSVETEAPVQEEAPKKESHGHRAPKKEADPEECSRIVKEFLTDMFAAMQMDVTIETCYDSEDGALDVELSGPEMGVIIGKRGQTLDSVQYLANLALNRKIDTYTRVKIDTENYRARRKETLENLARNVAYRVKRTRRSASLEPMNPYERRIIHSALQSNRYVTTHSEGEEPYRHVVVTLKSDDDRQ